MQLSKGNDAYTVTKTVKASAKVILNKNGTDISGHTATQTYKLIQEIIGLDFTTFTKLIYQSMESSLDFLKATDANRKKFFMSLFNLSEYSETETKLKEAYAATKKELDTTKTKMDTVKYWLDGNTDIIRQEKRNIEPLDIEELEEEVASLRADIKNIDVQNKNARAEQLLRDHLTRVQNTSTAPCHDNSKELKVSVRAYEEQNVVNIQLSTKYRIAKEALRKARDYKENCPTCGQDINHDGLHDIMLVAEAELGTAEKLMTEAISKLTQIEHEMKELNIEQQAYKAYTKYCETLEKAELAIDISKPTQIQTSKALTELMGKAKLEIQMRKDDYDADINFNNRVDINNAKCDQMEIQTSKYKTELAIHISKLTQIREIESDLKILKDSFSGKGLVNFKIESLIKGFENEINNNLIKLTDGQFALGFNIEDSKLKLTMYSHGVEVSIKSLSTGESNKLTMSSLLAVRSMMAKLSDVSINLLFLDEVISVLSPTSLETLIDYLLKENLNTFIVSHGYAHPLAEEITLEKTNNISRKI